MSAVALAALLPLAVADGADDTDADAEVVLDEVEVEEVDAAVDDDDNDDDDDDDVEEEDDGCKTFSLLERGIASPPAALATAVLAR